ncbi:MAG: hypothetical protein GVX78_04200 [Bacteroidetes bacterium]|jgi:hypothetical protein|nr:hypothetical protein [Bacteroidota bacterium]
MKCLAIIILSTISSYLLGCGFPVNDGWRFYNLIEQTSISAEEYYPFLREDDASYYEGSKDHNKRNQYRGNVALWKELLKDWNEEEIMRSLYYPEKFSWRNKNSDIEKEAKKYIDFAHQCSMAFEYRKQLRSWDYNKHLKRESPDLEGLLTEGNKLLYSQAHVQMQARYYYQIVRILHYSKRYTEATELFEAKIRNRFPKNEIYFYILDQIAGCYYSLKQYNKAAYLFTTVFANSIDRKKSAFQSFNFCTFNNAEGRPFIKDIEEEKNLLIIISLRGFSNEYANLEKFISLGANDDRIELLFMRALNNLERRIWPKNIGFDDKTLPNLSKDDHHFKLIQIAERQVKNPAVQNKDFWSLASSYLSFVSGSIEEAEQKLNQVRSFDKQKKELKFLYQVFSSNEPTPTTDSILNSILQSRVIHDTPTEELSEDVKNLILDRMGHIYYKNGQLAKAFLLHNRLENIKNIHSLELLNSLETFYYKPAKTELEQFLISKEEEDFSFIDYVNHHKGIYYLYDQQAVLALQYFERVKTYQEKKRIPNTIFSNNLTECFSCDAGDVMDDEVFKADLFSFITDSFSRKNLAGYLIHLTKLTSEKKQWKAKLANYLLANYYYNISNTGYYRGLLTGNNNIGDKKYIDYAVGKDNSTKPTGKQYISKGFGYNMKTLSRYYSRSSLEKNHFNLSRIAFQFYQTAIDLSTDKEFNARCTYLMAKCELNDFYNNGGTRTFKFLSDNYNWRGTRKEVELPLSESFKALREKYQNTEFHKLIIQECSYFRVYSNNY